jgi:hypothetical protein
MSAPAFDPWVALARIERENGGGAVPPPAPPPPPPISRISGISRGAPFETEKPAAPDDRWWLADIARSIRAALADGADRDADPDGYLVLVRPEGERLVVTPATFASLDAAGLLPALPPALAPSRNAATARPPCWSDPDDLPVEGDRCRCGGHRWWTYAPKPDGWCCVTCRPPVHLRAEAVREVTT